MKKMLVAAALVLLVVYLANHDHAGQADGP